jgi:hypothetical protein
VALVALTVGPGECAQRRDTGGLQVAEEELEGDRRRKRRSEVKRRQESRSGVQTVRHVVDTICARQRLEPHSLPILPMVTHRYVRCSLGVDYNLEVVGDAVAADTSRRIRHFVG